MIVGVLLVLGGRRLGRRAHRPAAARPHRPHRGRDRRRRPLAPRRGDRRAHRGRPRRASRSTRCSTGSSRRSPSARRARTGCASSSPTPRTSCARRWRRSAATRSCSGWAPRASRPGRREGDAADRGRGGAHGRARRGPADARAARRGGRRPARRGRPRPRSPRDAVDDARATAPDRADRASRADGPAVVLGDAHQLRQVLGNLCATRSSTRRPSTPDRGHRRHARTATCGSRCATTAPACPPTTPNALFERFWRAEGGRERGKGGAGLGLAIVAGIVDAHGGRVHARRTPTAAARRSSVVLPAA